MEKLRIALTLALTAFGTMLMRAIAAPSAFADHTSGDRILGEVGVEVILFAIVVIAAVAAIVAFSVGILWWERQDGEVSDSDQSN